MGCSVSTVTPVPLLVAQPAVSSPSVAKPSTSPKPPKQAEAQPANGAEAKTEPAPNILGASVSDSSSEPGQLRTSTSAILPKHISPDELGQLCQATNFDRKQVERLYEVFKVISSSSDDDGLIDKKEFETALGLKSSLFVDRIFAIFDRNSDHKITFEEFVVGLSTFSSRASREDKAAMSFRIFDIDGDGVISREDLGLMVRATIRENDVNISDEQFEVLIATTFEQAGASEKKGISADQFLALVIQRPAMLSNMTIASISVSR
mmetsp:Transcript_5663/g.14149  ORF Transcript_5663/g.14149 Transcript_5663/m.14149 type:complete len:264 (+) Transcript_5663:94-885(+)